MQPGKTNMNHTKNWSRQTKSHFERVECRQVTAQFYHRKSSLSNVISASEILDMAVRHSPASQWWAYSCHSAFAIAIRIRVFATILMQSDRKRNLKTSSLFLSLLRSASVCVFSSFRLLIFSNVKVYFCLRRNDKLDTKLLKAWISSVSVGWFFFALHTLPQSDSFRELTLSENCLR